MTEHDKLREAINSLCSACQKTLVIGPAADRMTRTVWEDDLIRVLAAAEQSLTFRRLPLPGELDDEALSLLYAGCFGTQPRSKNESMRAGYRALYEHLTKPKRVWRVSAGGINIVHVHETEDAALERAKELLRNGEVAVITSTKESA